MLDNVLDRSLAMLGWDWRFTTLGIIFALFTTTWAITTIKSIMALRATGNNKTPPIVPYAVPLLGNMYDFAFNTKGFLSHLINTYGSMTPVRFRVIDMKIHFISGAENLLAIFRGSRDLTTTPSSILVLENAFGSPASVNHIMTKDKTGVSPQPLKGVEPIEPHNRIFHIMHKNLHTHLNGKGLAALGEKFTFYLQEEMSNLNIGKDEWTEIPDLYRMVQMIVFTASTKALCGPHLFDLNPDFSSDFWEFDSHVPNLFRILPRWMIPAAYRVRDKLKVSIGKWHVFAEDHFDANLEAIKPQDWEEFYGTRLMRERQIDHRNIEGYTDEARAANDLGMIWGANANSVPVVGWVLLDTLLRPDLLSETKKEIAMATTTTKDGICTLDVPKLLSQPLLQSIYSEELRMRAGVAIQRVPVIDNFSIGPWKFPRDQMIVASSWHEHRDTNIWNEGPVKGVLHSVEDFWAERFLTFPDDPNSGPRKPDSKFKSRVRLSRDDEKVEDEGRQNSKPVYTLDPVQGSYVPYGGGLKMCPGRFYAKQEIIVAAAMFLTKFDIELENKDFPRPNLAYFPFGVVPPLGKFPAKLKMK